MGRLRTLWALCCRCISSIMSIGIDEHTPKQMAITVRLTNFIALVGGLNTLPLVFGLVQQKYYVIATIISLVLPGYGCVLYYNYRQRYTLAKIIITLSVLLAFGLTVLYTGRQVLLASCFLLHIGGTTLLFSNHAERTVFLRLIVFELVLLSSFVVLSYYSVPPVLFPPQTLRWVQIFLDISAVYLNIAIVLYFLHLFYERDKAAEQAAQQLLTANVALERSNQELVRLNDEKNELMSIVAHDLKNPISVVHGMAGLIYHNFAPPEETQEMAHKIILTSDRMLELVKNLLELNRLEMGVFSFEIKHVNILPIIDSIVGQYEDSARLKDISIHAEKPPTQAIALVDEQVFISIVDNLLSNAMKFSLSGKQIVVRAIHSSDSQDSSSQASSSQTSTIRIEIQDEGPGISPEEMTKLFGKFVRLSARPTGGEHSTGLGLSIVKKMVEAMQGRVWCESELGKGATFIVELPGV